MSAYDKPLKHWKKCQASNENENESIQILDLFVLWFCTKKLIWEKQIFANVEKSLSVFSSRH